MYAYSPQKNAFVYNVYIYILSWALAGSLQFLCGQLNSFLFSDNNPIFFDNDNQFWITKNIVNIIQWLGCLPSLYLLFSLYSLFNPTAICNSTYTAAKEGKINPSNKLYIRYVTRGTHPHVIAYSIGYLMKELCKCHIINQQQQQQHYQIEIVTDQQLDNELFPEQLHVRQLVVPSNYTVQDVHRQEALRFKARALQYALETSDAQSNDYILHLDEETIFPIETLYSILTFIQEQEHKQQQQQQQQPRVGQGIILYNQSPKGYVSWEHVITTLADSLRVTDDMGKFKLFYTCGTPYLGMKGSFIVIRNDIEKKAGFNYGHLSDITEDCHLALRLAQSNIQFEFIPSVMYERSPFTFMDFIKQRRRWWIGLCRIVRDTDSIQFKYRCILMIMMVLWTLNPCIYLSIFCQLLLPTAPPTITSISTWISLFFFSLYFYLYLLGFFHSFSVKHIRYTRMQYIAYFLLQVICIPIFAILETISVIYAICNPSFDFYIVAK